MPKILRIVSNEQRSPSCAKRAPSMSYAVDLWPLARHPSVDRIRPAQPGRQPSLHPAGNALVEVETAAPRAAQRRGRILADTLTLRAIGNDCSAGRQGVQPLRIVLRIATHRADDEAIVGVEVVATANIDQNWREGRAQARIELIGRNRVKSFSVHAQSPRQASVAQSLDGNRLKGSLHIPLRGTLDR